MRINGIALQAAALAAALLSTGAARAETTPLGLWIDHTGRGAVEITDCGNRLCGHIAWLKDAKNAEACGEQVIGDVKPVGAGKWDQGWIYDPDADAKYDVELTPVAGDKLRVVGYSGSKWLSETMTWKRAPTDLQKCTKPGAGAAAPAAATPVAAAATPVPAAAAAAEPVKTDAATEPEAKTEAKTAAKTEPAAMTAAAPETKADKKKKTAEPDGAKMVSQLVQALNDDGEDAGSGKSRSKGKRTCKMQVPYLDMVVSIPCED